MKKQVKRQSKNKEPEPTNAELKRYIGVLNEGTNHRINAIGEQFLGLNDKIDDVKTVVNSHTEMIGRIMIDIEEIKSGFKTKVSYDDFAKLEKRVVQMEAKLAGKK